MGTIFVMSQFSYSIRGLVLLVIYIVTSSSMAAEVPIIDPTSRFHSVYGKSGMVVSQEIIASQVGADILDLGGNAIDAAVATGFALAVTLPRAGNLAGGGFMLIHLAEENKTIALDYREMAPAAAERDMFLDLEGNAVASRARDSRKSSGVPGTVAGLLYAHKNYGRLSLDKVIGPAIELASGGFSVSVDLSTSLESRISRLSRNEASKAYFYKANGQFYQPGDQLVQKDLAATLERIGKEGRAGFYQGKTAELIVAEMERGDGLISLQDLENYKVITRIPVCGDFKTSIVCGMPPPSSGGVHLIQMLNILEGWDLKSLGHNSAAYLHRLTEAMRRVYADRSAYLGDPDFYNVPVGAITDKRYAAALRSGIDLNKASRSNDVKPGLSLERVSLLEIPVSKVKESEETTHLSTWDQWGNVVSSTTTLNFSYGNGISVAGTGFLLNNEMDDFSSKPGSPNGFGLLGGEANAIEPGKRPLSSMSPSLVFNAKGRPILATGSPGGATIINVVLQIILNVLTFEMGIAEASAVPRIHHQWYPDTLYYESGIGVDTLNILRDMGHNVNDTSRILGATQSIQRGSGDVVLGASDPRRQGAGVAPQEPP